MSEKQELLEMLAAYRDLELRNVKKCQEREERLKSPGSKLMLAQIRMDSAKHAHVLQTLIDITQENTPEYLWNHRIDKYVGNVSVQKALEDHIEMEHEMIQRCQNLINKTEDSSLKAILNFLITDEKTHEQQLIDVVKRFGKLESR